jgi:competence protein ComER
MRIGFIGTGSMGSMLARGYCEVSDQDCQILACNRTRAKVEVLIQEYPSIQVVDTIQELAALSDILFLCVKATDAWEILQDLKHLLSEDQYLVSINSAISMNEMEDMLKCSVIKIIPSITQEARSGIILTMFGSRMDMAKRSYMEGILGKIGTPKQIPEEKVRIYSDLTSCGPAFFSFMVREWVAAAAEIGGISNEQAESMALETLNGLVRLIRDREFTIEDVLRRVTVPGGVTEVGLNVLEPVLHNAFTSVFQATQSHQNHPKKI